MAYPESSGLRGRDGHPSLSRRDFLYVGVAGGLAAAGGWALTLGDLLWGQAAAAAAPDNPKAPSAPAADKPEPPKEAVAKSIIQIYLPGGIAASESWDPKPLAPVEYRGPLGTVPTKITGVVFSDVLPRTAAIADQLTICRAMTHGEAAHERGTHNMFTGYRPSPALAYPSIGSVVSEELGPRGEMPPYVCIPTLPTPYAGSGYLSTKFGPFSVGADPAGGDFKVRDLSLPDDVDHERFRRRQKLVEAVDQHFESQEKSDALEAMDEFYKRAYGVISSKKAREAFDLSAEPAAVRDAYGRNAAGQRMLLCRRLAEAGVRLVTMVYGGWDHHVNIRDGVRSQMPAFDQGFAALIGDLRQRGLLDSTLVTVTSEFGRTPKINADAGRDHHPRVFSIVLAGGGIQKGMVYGSADSTGTGVDSDALSVEDFAATLYNQIGIDPEHRLTAPGGRPVAIVRQGKVVRKIVAKG